MTSRFLSMFSSKAPPVNPPAPSPPHQTPENKPQAYQQTPENKAQPDLIFQGMALKTPISKPNIKKDNEISQSAIQPQTSLISKNFDSVSLAKTLEMTPSQIIGVPPAIEELKSDQKIENKSGNSAKNKGDKTWSDTNSDHGEAKILKEKFEKNIISTSPSFSNKANDNIISQISIIHQQRKEKDIKILFNAKLIEDPLKAQEIIVNELENYYRQCVNLQLEQQTLLSRKKEIQKEIEQQTKEIENTNKTLDELTKDEKYKEAEVIDLKLKKLKDVVFY